ncbi:MAG: DUF5685 family protein [Bacillota bacterium]|nr:DUF5685 family protein [Bacillota bacterium]
MFGYVVPFKPELKIKDYEKFKGYYCGLCFSIKRNYGNIPRLALNYDMTFLALLLDSLGSEQTNFKLGRCAAHPLKKKIIVKNNTALDYAAFCNIALTYYKMTDNVKDENSLLSSFFALCLKRYFNKFPHKLENELSIIKNKLNELSALEIGNGTTSLDEISHPFADLTGHILEAYLEYKALDLCSSDLYWLGYNLGKWIYIIDAFDDLKDDMIKNKFNAVNFVFNKNNLDYISFFNEIKPRIEFTLVSCASACLDYLEKLPINRNKDLLINILQLGLMHKIHFVLNPGNNNKNSI